MIKIGLFETKIKRLTEWAKGNKQGPISIELVPTDKCNLNCKSCWRQGYTEEDLEEIYSKEISDKRLLKLIDEAAELGTQEIIFVGGGEPFARDILPKLIKKIKGYGMEGDLVTNGTLLTKEKIHLLIRSGWNRIKFSIDGPDPKVHDELRGKEGTFEKAVDNIKATIDLREKYNRKKPKLYFNTVVSNRNYKKLPEVVRLAGKLNMDGIQLLPTTAFSNSSKDMQLNKEETQELMDIIEQCMELSKEVGLTENNFSEYSKPKYIEKTESMHQVHQEELKEQFPEEKIEKIIDREYSKEEGADNFKYLPCYAPWHHITIRPNGNIAPCFSPWVWDTEVSIKDRSLEDIWYGEKFDNYRRIMLERKLPDQCKRCCVWEVFKNRRIRSELDKKFKGIGKRVKDRIKDSISD